MLLTSPLNHFDISLPQPEAESKVPCMFD